MPKHTVQDGSSFFKLADFRKFQATNENSLFLNFYVIESNLAFYPD